MAKNSIPLTVERLKGLVHYDPETGTFTATCDRLPIKAGDRLGWINGKGYNHIMLDRRTYRTNRLAWLYMTGEWPVHQVDHEDRNKTNDRWSNLRHATNQQNQQNVGLSKRNTSGHRGVMWHKRIGKWQACIRVSRKLISLGYFTDITDAIAARRAAEAEHFGEFAPA